MASCYSCYYFTKGSNWCSKYDADWNEYPLTKYYRHAEDCPYYDNASDNHSGNHGSDCFLTSACVGYLGKSDDCEELTTLRAFRDGYMRGTSEGEELIKEYYAIAPQIVQKIDASEQKNCAYRYIYSVVQKCVGLIKQNKNEETMDEYKNMVLTLKKQFA